MDRRTHATTAANADSVYTECRRPSRPQDGRAVPAGDRGVRARVRPRRRELRWPPDRAGHREDHAAGSPGLRHQVPCDRQRGASRQRPGRLRTSRQRWFPSRLRGRRGQATSGTRRGGPERRAGSGDRHRRRRGPGWLVHGLGARRDVEVVTVEIDDEVQRTALSAPWPPWVRFESGDGAEVVGRLGQFDLIFPDAPGGKIFKLRRTVAALRRGGVLLVDDMDLTRHDDQKLRSSLAVVRDRLLGNAHLACAELGFSGGVIVASSAGRDLRSGAPKLVTERDSAADWLTAPCRFRAGDGWVDYRGGPRADHLLLRTSQPC